MSFSSKINLTYEVLKTLGKQSLSKIAKLTNVTKSSVHRQTKKIQGRSEIIGASFFETVEGAIWLRKLVLAATLIFGLQNKAGGAKLALFFETICITQFVGVSESSMVRLKNAMMEELQKYQAELQPLLVQMASSLSITVGADETFFECLLILVFMDLSSGFIFLEEATADRKALTWENKTTSIRDNFKSILCMVTDRGASLVKFAKDTAVKSIQDLFHLQQSVVRLFKFSFASKRRSLKKEEKELNKELDRLVDSKAEKNTITKFQQAIKDIADKNNIINQGQMAYQQQLKAISTCVHPFGHNERLAFSKEVNNKLQSSLMALRTIAKDCEINDPKGHLNYFENHIKDISPLIDLWWQWVDCDLANKKVDSELQSWLKTKLLPVLYWKQQIKKSRA